MKEHNEGLQFEPQIDTIYLQSYRHYLPLVEELLSSMPAKRDAMTITPEILKGSPFCVCLYGSWDEKQEIRVGTIHADVTFSDGKPITTGSAGIIQYVYKKDREIRGRIDNDTLRIPGSRRIRNLSGILAPVQDAICQAAADRLHLHLTARVATSYSQQTRFVQNYLMRDYRTITKPRPDAIVTILEKQFVPL